MLDFATEKKAKKLDHIVNTTGDKLYNPLFSDLTIDNIYEAEKVRVMAPLMLVKHAPTYLNNGPSSITSGSGTYKRNRVDTNAGDWGYA